MGPQLVVSNPRHDPRGSFDHRTAGRTDHPAIVRASRNRPPHILRLLAAPDLIPALCPNIAHRKIAGIAGVDITARTDEEKTRCRLAAYGPGFVLRSQEISVAEERTRPLLRHGAGQLPLNQF